MNAFWFDFVQRTYIDDNHFWLSLVLFDTFWFALIHRTDMLIMSILRTHLRVIRLLCVCHLRFNRANMPIESHHTLSNLSCWIKVTISRFMFGPLPHIILISKLLKLFNNPGNILQTDIINGMPCLFVFIWPYNGIETKRGNQPLSWYSQKIFWFWICDFHLVQTTKIQRYVQGDVLLTILDRPVFPNIVMTTIFYVRRCELFLPECLLSGTTMINRRRCYNC